MRNVVYDIVYDGRSIPCYVTFKRMRSITFRLDRDGKSMKVSCPTRTSEKFLREKINEVFPRLYQKIQYQKPENGDAVYLFGEEKTIPGFDTLPLEKKKKYYRFLLLPYCEEKVKEYEKTMGIALPYMVAVRDMRSRYGVNNRKNHKVTFALSLVHYSPRIIDSVIVHELAHHFVFDHSESFYKIVYRYYPSYKEYHTKLRKHIYQ